MAKQAELERARLIPVSGIGTTEEAEQRATSAFLAVLTIVRDFSDSLLTPLGASRAQRATVEAFSEVTMKVDGKTVRPDGLIRVSYGKSTWSSFVEVKTRDNWISADQINSYWDVARQAGVDHILTISNEIAPTPGMHPTEGLKVRSNSKVGVSHLSWTAILTTALRIKHHAGVDDEEQAWILGELIRYMQHRASGILDFGDMGPNWVSVRDGARAGDLTKRSEGVEDISRRWDQLLRSAALGLSSDIGEDVTMIVPRKQRDPKHRLTGLVDSLCSDGVLSGGLRIPNTAGDIDITADLRARHLTASMEVTAPNDKGAVGRVSWLARQLVDAQPSLIVESYPKNARTGTSATLAAIREDRAAVLDEEKREPNRFRLVMRSDMGMGRSTGKRSPGFIDSVRNLIDDFYSEVVQTVTPWQPPAPKVKRTPSSESEPMAVSESGQPAVEKWTAADW